MKIASHQKHTADYVTMLARAGTTANHHNPAAGQLQDTTCCRCTDLRCTAHQYDTAAHPKQLHRSILLLMFLKDALRAAQTRQNPSQQTGMGTASA
jgi:hypothetical protein